MTPVASLAEREELLLSHLEPWTPHSVRLRNCNWCLPSSESKLQPMLEHIKGLFGQKSDDGSLEEILVKLAASGDAEDQCRVANAYFGGSDGFPLDYEKAAHWAALAAHQNHAQAQFLYGLCLMEGSGVQQDQFQSESWFFAAAQGGSAEASCMMGISHTLTKSECYKWLRIASESANAHTAAYAIEQMALLEQTMSESQVTDARDTAITWIMTKRRSIK